MTLDSPTPDPPSTRLLYEPVKFGESFEVQIMWRGRSITAQPIVVNTKSASHPQTLA